MERDLLVIGATGQTGGHTAELLLQRGHHVRALVRRVDERSERLAGLGAQIVEGDVQDLNSLAEGTKGDRRPALHLPAPSRPGAWSHSAPYSPVGVRQSRTSRSAASATSSGPAKTHSPHYRTYNRMSRAIVP
ncbi:NmrA family NAD(P)-binding protein [Streptomyces sp. NPDC002928]|uniref:SDR family oxidoreductase n=1 Tax=Streptomyces sp. NPDC002928 TaxID=3154440 RepID=UPI0033B49963